MAGSDQTLNVKLTADESDLVAATTNASKSLDNLKADVDKVDASSIEISADLELDRLNRDIANLNKVLDGIERRKAEPDVDLDITQLLRDEARVRKQLDGLDQRKVEVEATVTADTTGLTKMSALLDDLDSSVGGMVPGLGGLTNVTKGLGTAAGVAGVAFGSWQLGSMAADVETTTLQLAALTGSAEEGAEAFEMLRDFAAATPFELNEVTTAARYLLAAGLDLDQIAPILDDLGNVAAATGTPVEEIAQIFQQMIGKGKISNEEMLQLAERGVPAYQALADTLGITVADVQKLAENGELGADAIAKLSTSLGDLYPTAMIDQAGTFNGQMSTLHDNITQLGSNLGEIFLPALTDLVGLLNQAAGGAAKATAGMKGWIEELQTDQDVVEEMGDDPWWETGLKGIKDFLTWSPPGTTTEELKAKSDALEAAKGSTTELGDALAKMGTTIGTTVDSALQKNQEELAAAAAEAEAWSAAIEEAFAPGIEIRTHVSFLISQDDLADAIRKATRGADAISLPAHLTMAGIDNLSTAQKDLVNNLSSFVSAGITEGTRRAEIDPSFDATAWNRKVANQARQLVIRAGIDPSAADKFLKDFLGIDRRAVIKADIDDGSKAQADAQLDAIAAANRIAKIIPFLDPGSTNEVARQLDTLTAPETKAIVLDITRQISEIVLPFGRGGARSATSQSAAGQAGPQLLGASRAMAATSYVPGAGGISGGTRGAAATAERRRLAPKQTPIAVYLDGAEIADQLSLRTDRLAVSRSVRREA